MGHLLPLLFVALTLLMLSAAGALADDHRPPEPLPLPAVAAKGTSATAAAGTASGATGRTFRVPLGFARVEKFYRSAFAGDPNVTITAQREPPGRVLILASRRPTDAWVRAVVREAGVGAVDTVIEVTPVIRLGGDRIEGRPAGPLVHFVIPANPEVLRQAASIDSSHWK